MRMRIAAVLLAALAAALLVSAVAGAAMIGDLPQRRWKRPRSGAQLVKLSGGSCTRGGADGALRIAIGKATAACAYRTPVLGRDLEIAATERLLSGTPPALQRKAYLGAASCGPGAAPSTRCWSSRCSARSS